jgi:hypothetical protein
LFQKFSPRLSRRWHTGEVQDLIRQPGRVSGLVEQSYFLPFLAVFFFVDFLAVFFLAAM